MRPLVDFPSEADLLVGPAGGARRVHQVSVRAEDQLPRAPYPVFALALLQLLCGYVDVNDKSIQRRMIRTQQLKNHPAH
jgi:hypothetical protein